MTIRLPPVWKDPYGFLPADALRIGAQPLQQREPDVHRVGPTGAGQENMDIGRAKKTGVSLYGGIELCCPLLQSAPIRAHLRSCPLPARTSRSRSAARKTDKKTPLPQNPPPRRGRVDCKRKLYATCAGAPAGASSTVVTYSAAHWASACRAALPIRAVTGTRWSRGTLKR